MKQNVLLLTCVGDDNVVAKVMLGIKREEYIHKWSDRRSSQGFSASLIAESNSFFKISHSNTLGANAIKNCQGYSLWNRNRFFFAVVDVLARDSPPLKGLLSSQLPPLAYSMNSSERVNQLQCWCASWTVFYHILIVDLSVSMLIDIDNCNSDVDDLLWFCVD